MNAPVNSYTSRQRLFNSITLLISRAFTHYTFRSLSNKELNLIKKIMLNQDYSMTIFNMLKNQIINRDNNKKLKARKETNKITAAISFNKSFYPIIRLFKNIGYNIAFETSALKNLIVSECGKKRRWLAGYTPSPLKLIMIHFIILVK